MINKPNELTPTTIEATPASPTGFTVEHVLLSVAVVSVSRLAQYDDSCAHILKKAFREYGEVRFVEPNVIYNHTTSEIHQVGCGCFLARRP